MLWAMNAEKRKTVRLRLQTSKDLGALRKRLADAAMQLPPALPLHTEKLAALARCLLTGNLPKKVVLLVRGHFAIRPCVGGVVFTAAVIQSLGTRENHKLVGPMSRLSDAIAFHFRNSRMRGVAEYNLSEAQAAIDAVALSALLNELSKILSDAGVPNLLNPTPVAEAEPCETNEVATLLAYVTTLEARIISTEKVCNTLMKRIDNILNPPHSPHGPVPAPALVGEAVPEPLAPLHKPSAPEVIEKNIECPGIPSAF